MKKALWVITIFTGTLIMVLLLQPALVRNEPKPTEADDLAQYRYVAENGTQPLSVSQVAAKLTYAREDGSAPIYYYIVKTTYYEEEQTNLTGLHADAFHTVFDPHKASSAEERMIQQWPGCLYVLPERSYLCWTVTPDISYILEYDPAVVPDADILRMAQSTALPRELN